MRTLRFEEFTDRIYYYNEASQEQENELRHWLEMIGTYKYSKYYNVLFNETAEITFDDLKNCAKYDFNLSRILFTMLKHCENYLRATITSSIDDFVLNEVNCQEIIGNKFGARLGPNFKVYWHLSLNFESSFYKYLDASALSTIIAYYLALPPARIIFDLEEVRKNLFLVKDLRNHVYHHNCLLDDMSINNNLKSQIILLFRYLPSPSTRRRYIASIEEELDRVGAEYNYPIHFSPKEKDEIMNYRGCNNEYKD